MNSLHLPGWFKLIWNFLLEIRVEAFCYERADMLVSYILWGRYFALNLWACLESCNGFWKGKHNAAEMLKPCFSKKKKKKKKVSKFHKWDIFANWHTFFFQYKMWLTSDKKNWKKSLSSKLEIRFYHLSDDKLIIIAIILNEMKLKAFQRNDMSTILNYFSFNMCYLFENVECHYYPKYAGTLMVCEDECWKEICWN